MVLFVILGKNCVDVAWTDEVPAVRATGILLKVGVLSVYKNNGSCNSKSFKVILFCVYAIFCYFPFHVVIFFKLFNSCISFTCLLYSLTRSK